MDPSTLHSIADSFNRDPRYLLDMLRTVQDRFRCVSDPAIDGLAEVLAIPRQQVAGVAGFYSFLTEAPVGAFHVLFSDNITDEMAGKNALQQRLLERLGVALGETRADQRVRVEDTACTGMSDQGPALLVNGQALPRLDEARIDAIAELIEANTPLDQWPRAWFEIETNIHQAGFLLEEPFAPGAALAELERMGAGGAWDEIQASGLHGCGGAGFKTGLKWQLCKEAPGEEHYVVCNADEGEPGTFKDRVLLQAHADLVIEGMTVCARIIGSGQGFLYLRGEYAYLRDGLEQTLARRREAGLLGKDFDIELRLGAGAYICGEESALIRSLEGTRGHPRIRPPFPVTHGYRQQPTVVNNVETFAQAARILSRGAARFSSLGTDNSRGTKLLSISGDCARPGIYEFAYGTPIRDILSACGADNPQAVQVAGAAGTTLSPAEFDRVLAFEDVPTGGSFMIFSQDRNLLDMTRNFARFFVHESCGFCTPCRIGTSLLQQSLDKILAGHGGPLDVEQIRDLAKVMKSASQCGLGATAPNHLIDTLNKFPEIYQQYLKADAKLEPSFDIEEALSEARRIASRAA